MGRTVNGKANLIHNAKRCYVYEYGTGNLLDGKITISKRILEEKEIDFVDAIETREIEIINASDASDTVNLAGLKIDNAALSVITAIFDVFETTGLMPENIGYK